MALVTSQMIPLGTIAPDFILPDPRTNKRVSLSEMKSPVATVIMFLSNHCPYVKFIQKKLAEIATTYQSKDIQFIAICANDVVTHPEDGPVQMALEAQENHYTFPYLYDETQEIAKAYHAECTPDFFIFDKNLACVYRGRFDEATPGNNKPVTGEDLQAALDNILKGEPVSSHQLPSMGCNIKWKAET